jgi:hypothetical protein
VPEVGGVNLKRLFDFGVALRLIGFALDGSNQPFAIS